MVLENLKRIQQKRVVIVKSNLDWGGRTEMELRSHALLIFNFIWSCQWFWGLEEDGWKPNWIDWSPRFGGKARNWFLNSNEVSRQRDRLWDYERIELWNEFIMLIQETWRERSWQLGVCSKAFSFFKKLLIYFKLNCFFLF
jgi:hypothetical protein